ncbi:MAG: hypothetical protein JNL83_38890 [Myxococcales bacterium]|nr:hypothetical protein [Myxococcales bacterium]
MRASNLLLIALLSTGCGGITAEAPITLKVGTDRAAARKELRAHKFCFKEDGGPQPNPDVFPRCSRAGAEWGESWVAVRYEAEKVVEVKRYERYSDDARAVERWNQLVGDRTKLHPDAPDATAFIQTKALEPGTRSVKAWRLDPQTVVGAYLLTPTPPANASVLEAIYKFEKTDSGIEVIED